MMREQTDPKQLVRDVALAEEADFPWLETQGHSQYTWSVLGARPLRRPTAFP